VRKAAVQKITSTKTLSRIISDDTDKNVVTEAKARLKLIESTPLRYRP